MLINSQFGSVQYISRFLLTYSAASMLVLFRDMFQSMTVTSLYVVAFR